MTAEKQSQVLELSAENVPGTDSNTDSKRQNKTKKKKKREKGGKKQVMFRKEKFWNHCIWVQATVPNHLPTSSLVYLTII